ncbi:MAG: nuclear transport factor 2 family protein [Acidobacteriota bacterium]|nr:nuclear transport factor 2 family protein [Acidobacteriota bacterium]
MSDTPMQALLRALDALDLEAAVALFAPDATLSMLFGETATGRDRVREVLGEFIRELRANHHEVSAEWNPEPGVWLAEMSATYELADFSRRGPYGRVMVLRAGDDGIEQLRSYGAHELPLAQDGRPYENVRGPHGWLPTL